MLLENASAIEQEREEKRTKEERKRIKTERGETRDDGGTLMRCVSTTCPRRVRTS